MRGRVFAGCLVLLLAVVSLAGITLDGIVLNAPVHHQWRAPSPPHAGQRTAPRHAQALLAESVVPPTLLPRLTSVPFAPRPELTSPLLASVFIPPRV